MLCDHVLLPGNPTRQRQKVVLAGSIHPTCEEPVEASAAQTFDVLGPVPDHVRQVMQDGERHGLVRQEFAPIGQDYEAAPSSRRSLTCDQARFIHIAEVPKDLGALLPVGEAIVRLVRRCPNAWVGHQVELGREDLGSSEQRLGTQASLAQGVAVDLHPEPTLLVSEGGPSVCYWKELRCLIGNVRIEIEGLGEIWEQVNQSKPMATRVTEAQACPIGKALGRRPYPES